jgi:hypothetical protein
MVIQIDSTLGFSPPSRIALFFFDRYVQVGQHRCDRNAIVTLHVVYLSLTKVFRVEPGNIDLIA